MSKQLVKLHHDHIEEMWSDLYRKSMGVDPPVKILDLVQYKWPRLYIKLDSLYGLKWQAMVTGLLHQYGIKITGVERECTCISRIRYKNCAHDIDASIMINNEIIPLQIGTFKQVACGFLTKRKYDISNKEFMQKKIRQIPAGGIVLVEITEEMEPTSEWFKRMKNKCVIILKQDSAMIYYGYGGNAKAARKICEAFGFADVMERLAPND